MGKTIWVAGGDRRAAALARLMAEDGMHVHTYALEKAEGAVCEPSMERAGEADCIVLPMPATAQDSTLNAPLAASPHPLEEVITPLRPGQQIFAGIPGARLTALCAAHGLTLRDYGAREELALRNAIPTAEGAIQLAMEQLPVTVHGARVLILGFGRLGQALVPRLRGLGAAVFVAARRDSQRALAESMGAVPVPLDHLPDRLGTFDLVLNTIPSPVLGHAELSALPKGALVIDLASRPGGVDWDAAAALGVQAIHALALPGKVAPVSAAGYLKETIYHMMEE